MGKVTYLADNGNVISLDTIKNCYIGLEASINGIISTLDHIVSQTDIETEQYNQIIMIKQALKQNAADLDGLWPADPPFEESLRELKETRPGAISAEAEAVLMAAHASQIADKLK